MRTFGDIDELRYEYLEIPYELDGEVKELTEKFIERYQRYTPSRPFDRMYYLRGMRWLGKIVKKGKFTLLELLRSPLSDSELVVR